MLLREHVFIHMERPLDKLNALIAMTGKLFALVADLCGEDNADALSHHEVLLPGTLLSKFVSDKLAECLAIFKRQVVALSILAACSILSLTLNVWYILRDSSSKWNLSTQAFPTSVDLGTALALAKPSSGGHQDSTQYQSSILFFVVIPPLSAKSHAGCCIVQVLQDYDKHPEEVDLNNPSYLKKTSDRMPDIGRKVYPTPCAVLLV